MANDSTVRRFPEKMFSTTSAAVVVFNVAGEIVWINKAFEDSFGHNLVHLSNGDRWPFLAADHQEKVSSIIRQAFSGDPLESFDTPVICSDNMIKTVRWNTMLINDKPRQKAVVAFGIAAESQKRNQMYFAEFEEQFRLLFGNSNLSMVLVGEDMTIVLANKEFEKWTGYTKFQVEGKMSWTALIANEDDLLRMKEFHRLRRVDPALAPEMYETRIRNRDGNIRDVMLRVVIVPKTTYSIVSLQDMTEKRLAEEAIRESEKKYRSLVENMQDTLYRSDLQGNLTFVSPSGARLLGHDSWDELIGRNIAKDYYYHPDERTLLLSKLKTDGKVTNYEVTLKRKDGSPITVLTNSQLLRDKDGKILGIEGILSDMTERRFAEEKSRLSEEKFTKVFMMAPDMISITRMDDGLIVDVNIGFEEITGWKRDEVIGRTSYDLNFWVNPVERALMVEELEAGRDVVRHEFPFRRKDGSLRTGIYSARFIYIAGEACLVFVMQDITQLKETESILREKEERLRGITNNMPGAICQFYAKDSGERGMSYTSERLAELFELPVDTEMMLPAAMSYIYEEDRGRMLVSIREAVESVSTWNFEGRFVKSSGEVKWFHGLATPTRLEDQVVFNGILLDITDRKLAEKKIEETEIMYSTLVNSLSDAVMVTDLEGRIKFVSPQALKLYGFDRPEELISHSVMEVFAPESIEDVKTNSRRLLKDGKLPPNEYVLVKRDGSRFVAEVNSSVIRDASGNAKEMIGVTRNISERKRLEEEHRKLEQQLYQSQKMDAIGQLAGGVAHDFNNILTGIQGNAFLMRMEYRPEHPHYQRLSSIEEQVKRGANLTRQLLGVAREGKYEVKTVSVNDLIRKSAQFFLETRKEIEADCRLQDDVYPVEADAGQIEQVLLNLYINAGHAMPKGGSLYIQTTNAILQEAEGKAFETKPGNYVKISISDTGTGMDEETLRRIFEPFFTTKSQEGGTGLGLALAYGIIRNHGGVINAYSELGQGATFNIYLPSSKTNVKKEDQTPRKDLLSGNGNILLVDDESTILDPMSKLLKKLGYTVYPTTSGQEALSAYREKQGSIDLVILDMIMPGMSGSQVLTALKDINPDVKVVLSSGYSMKGEVRKVMEMGCCGFIQKPYNFEELSNIVHQALTGREDE